MEQVKEKSIKKHYNITPKPEHRAVLKKMSDKIRKGERVNKKEILMEVGYSESIAETPSRVLETQGFQQLLAKVSDGVILKRLLSIVTSDNSKDADAINSAKELLKLKDRYPAGKLKIQGYNDELNDIYA
jgi:hypothetical protein